MSKDRYLSEFRKNKNKKYLQDYKRGAYLHSIEGANKDLQQTEYFKQSSAKTQKALIDKFNLLIHLISTKNYSKHWGDVSKYELVGIHSKQLQSLLGNNYKNIIDVLVELDYLVVNRQYLPNHATSTNEGIKEFGFTRKYGLSDKAKALKHSKVGVLTSDVKRKIINYKLDYIEKLLVDDLHYQRLYNLWQLEYNGERIKPEADATAQQIAYFDKAYNDLMRFKNKSFLEFIYDSAFYYSPSLYGRIYDYFSTLPKGYYNGLTHKDGSKLSEIDGKQFQPFLQALKYTQHTGDKAILNDFIGKDWYGKVADFCLSNGFRSLGELYYTNRSDFKIKIIGDAFYSSRYDKEPMKALQKMYPNFAKWIVNCKNKYGYKSLSHNGHYEESNIFIYELSAVIKDKYWFVTKHDSALVKDSDVNIFVDALVKIMQNKYSFVEPEAFKQVFKVS